MMNYLKDKSHYIDLYDLWTVKDCLRIIESWEKIRPQVINDKKAKNLSLEEKERGFVWMLNWKLFIAKGERYQHKEETINDWLERDRQLDEKFNTAPESKNINCPDCGVLMENTFKDLYNFSNEPLRALFFFECPECQKRKGVFDDGQLYISKPEQCSKCQNSMNVSCRKNGDNLTWERKCHKCGFVETEVDDFKKSKAERLKREREDQLLLKKYRFELCLTEAQGFEYRESLDRIKTMGELVDKVKKEKSDPVYQRVKQLKRFTIVDLEEFLSKILEKEKYINLKCDKPEISKHVIVPFCIQDADSGRKEYDSCYKLQRIMKKILDDTNWRLMSEGVSYRLGYLFGRLKGYEQEDDLVQIVKGKQLASKQ